MENKTEGSKFLQVLKAEQKTMQKKPQNQQHKKTQTKKPQPKQGRGLSKLTWRCSWMHKIVTVHTEPKYGNLKLKATNGIEKLMPGVTNVLNTNIWSNTQ